MKKAVLYLVFFIFAIQESSLAGEGDFSISAGGAYPVDEIEQETGKGGYLDITYRLTKEFNLLFHAEKLISFEADNDLTSGELDLSMFNAGVRYTAPTTENSRGYIGVDIGHMEIDSDDNGDDAGSVCRFQVGADQYFFKRSGIRFGAGYIKGLGSLNEISFINFNLGFFIDI